jgi:hypothetical protein
MENWAFFQFSAAVPDFLVVAHAIPLYESQAQLIAKNR